MIKTMFEHNNGILVCTDHRTPAQKAPNGEFWCRACLQDSIRDGLPECCKDCSYIDGLGICLCGGCGAQDE